MGYCDPRQVRAGRPWYQTANDRLSPGILEHFERNSGIIVSAAPTKPELACWADELED